MTHLASFQYQYLNTFVIASFTKHLKQEIRASTVETLLPLKLDATCWFRAQSWA